MNYKNSKFYVENISIGKLTRSFQTPFYCYSKSRLSQNIKNFNKNLSQTSKQGGLFRCTTLPLYRKNDIN